MNDEIQPSHEGERLIKNWIESEKCVERSKRDLNRDETNELNAKDAIAKWLLPKDAKVGENFNLAYGNGFLNVRLLENRNPEVTWRTKPTER